MNQEKFNPSIDPVESYSSTLKYIDESNEEDLLKEIYFTELAKRPGGAGVIVGAPTAPPPQTDTTAEIYIHANSTVYQKDLSTLNQPVMYFNPTYISGFADGSTIPLTSEAALNNGGLYIGISTTVLDTQYWEYSQEVPSSANIISNSISTKSFIETYVRDADLDTFYAICSIADTDIINLKLNGDTIKTLKFGNTAIKKAIYIDSSGTENIVFQQGSGSHYYYYGGQSWYPNKPSWVPEIEPPTPSGYSVTIYNSTNLAQYGSITVYDGSSASSGTYLCELSSGPETVICTSGYLTLECYCGYGAEGITECQYFGLNCGSVYNSSAFYTDQGGTIVFSITSGGDILMQVGYECFIEGTQITLADGTTKAVEDITFNDSLLVWNFYEGKFDTAKPMWILNEKTANEYNLLRFSDGSSLGLVGNGKESGYHRIYNQQVQQFTHTSTKDTPIGTITFTDKSENIKLISQEIIKEPVKYYNIITDKHYNLFANGILTSCKLSNLYRIDNMKYTKDKLLSDDEIKDYINKLKVTGQYKF